MVQDYTTEFRRQALTPRVSLVDSSTYTKYVSGLHDRIRIDLSLFLVNDLSRASSITTTIERKNQARGEKKSEEGTSKQKKKFNSKHSEKRNSISNNGNRKKKSGLWLKED
ncbi:hypothetical protein ACH5RR_039492 [Cinchona calisaya]|uniref:Uncharacterized protein n=1 Tax=Cinchona calisaya TaxID=153742 RepID=A0ABD2XYF1_9GENT